MRCYPQVEEFFICQVTKCFPCLARHFTHLKKSLHQEMRGLISDLKLWVLITFQPSTHKHTKHKLNMCLCSCISIYLSIYLYRLVCGLAWERKGMTDIRMKAVQCARIINYVYMKKAQILTWWTETYRCVNGWGSKKDLFIFFEIFHISSGISKKIGR